MTKEFLLYVPSSYTLRNYFLPKLEKPAMESFEITSNRIGIQRKGNNHLVVFLEFSFKRPMEEFFLIHDGEAGDLFLHSPSDREFFRQMYIDEKEVSVFSLAYHPRMSVLAWESIAEIADDPRIIVRDVSDELIKGDELAREFKELLEFKRSRENP